MIHYNVGDRVCEIWQPYFYVAVFSLSFYSSYFIVSHSAFTRCCERIHLCAVEHMYISLWGMCVGVCVVLCAFFLSLN